MNNNIKIKAMRKQIEYCLNKKYDMERRGKGHPKEQRRKGNIFDKAQHLTFTAQIKQVKM